MTLSISRGLIGLFSVTSFSLLNRLNHSLTSGSTATPPLWLSAASDSIICAFSDRPIFLLMICVFLLLSWLGGFWLDTRCEPYFRCWILLHSWKHCWSGFLEAVKAAWFPWSLPKLTSANPAQRLVWGWLPLPPFLAWLFCDWWDLPLWLVPSLWETWEYSP